MFQKLNSSSDVLSKFENLEFYQKPYYLQQESELHKTDVTYFIFEENNHVLIIPFLKREIKSDRKTEEFDLVSPYGYPGFLSTLNDLDFLSRGIEQFCLEASKEKFISSFIRLNPYHNNLLFQESENLKQVIHGRVINVDLNNDYQECFSLYSTNHRRDIRKLKKSEYRIKGGNVDDLRDFILIYNNTMDRLDAQDYYYFPSSYYEEFFLNEKDNIDLIFVTNGQGEKISAALFIRNRNLIQYHLGATLTEYINDAPIKLIFDHIIEKYSASGLKLNLGGGLGSEEDSLFRFKNGFSPLNRKFSTLRIVHNPSRYKELCADFSKSEKKDLSGYFPLYRSKVNKKI